jgi:hypothetical protein
MAGTYSVTLTDANGCTDSTSVVITEPAPILISTVIDSTVSCNGLTNGGATASSTSGTTPYTYAWSNAATTPSITGVAAGSYTITITDASGCSSSSTTVITEPSLLVSTISLDSNESCINMMDGGLTAGQTGGTSSYSYDWSNTATTASITGLTAGTFSVTVTDANGCTDSTSMVIVHGLATASSNTLTVCDSVVSPSGMYTWVSTGVYLDTLTNSIGCDSVITTNLTVLNTTTSTQTITTCDAYNSPGGSFIWTASGTYSAVIPNAAGCDSLMTINLTIIHSTDTTISVVACGNYVSTSGQNWTSSGTYLDVIPNAAGCDSNITVNLTINNIASISQSPEICSGDSIQVGSNWYSLPGTYTDSLIASTGCDSVIITMLTVEVVDVTVTDFGKTLRADNVFATSYQWINCDSNNAIVTGATGQMFTPGSEGNYAVVVSSTNCSDTSICTYVNPLGINEVSSVININVYPNPTEVAESYVNIEVETSSPYDIIIRDLTGKVVYSKNDISVIKTEVDITKFAAGTFFIEIKTKTGNSYSKLIVM